MMTRTPRFTYFISSAESARESGMMPGVISRYPLISYPTWSLTQGKGDSATRWTRGDHITLAGGRRRSMLKLKSSLRNLNDWEEIVSMACLIAGIG